MFASDNITCVCPEVMSAVVAANSGDATPYGGDPVTQAMDAAFAAYFEAPVTVLPVATGTAANALSLSLATPRFGAIYAHERAHIHTTECGATEFWSGAAKILLLPGDQFRLTPEVLRTALAQAQRGRPHVVQPAVLSLTQGTEGGTIYTLEQIRALTAVAREAGLAVHMDGARFSNALVRLGCTPAEMTWRAGIDILSYGATKNGGMTADGIVIFRPELAALQAFTRVRSGQNVSKLRFQSAQLAAMVQGGVAERNAAHANAMADRLAAGLGRIAGIRLLHAVEINIVFAALSDAVSARLKAAGYSIGARLDFRGPHVRFVCAWNTEPEAVDRLIAAPAGT